MRHQSRDAAVTIEKWMNPEKPVMSSSNRDGLPRLRESIGRVSLLKAIHECRQIFCCPRNVPTHSNAASSQLTWNNLQSFTRVWVLNYEQALWQSRTELAMRPFDECARCGRLGKIWTTSSARRFDLRAWQESIR